MKLSDVCAFIVDCPHSTAKDEGSGYPLIRTPNIGKGRLLLDDVHRVSKDVYDKRNARAVPQNDDLILAREAPAGNVAIIKNDEKVCLGQRTVLIRPDKRKVYPDYLAYYILAPKQQYELLGTANGATVAHVNVPVIKNLPVELPDMKKQIKAAEMLKAYDDLIENNQRQIKLLEEAAQRLYKEWFVDLRFPGHEHLKIVDGVPEGWKKCILDDVIDFNPKMYIDKDRLKQSVPMSALSTTSMILDSKEFTTTASNAGSKFKNGDTLLARITPCLENGKTGFVDNIVSPEGAVGSTEFIVMRSKKINPYIVYLLSRTESFRKTAINSMTGSDGRQRAQVDKIKNYEYLLPTEDVISGFAELMEPLFMMVSACNKQCMRLTEARDRLLPKLMSGEIEV